MRSISFDSIVDHLMEIMKQVEKRKKRRDIKEARKAAVNIIRRHILPRKWRKHCREF